METIFARTSERSSARELHLLVQREDFALTALALVVSARNTANMETKLDLKEEAELLRRKLLSDDTVIEALPHCLDAEKMRHAVEGLQALKQRRNTPDPEIRGLARRAYRQIIRTAAAGAPSPYR